MAERPQPRGFDVNQPGSTQETFTGLVQGATTDLVGGVVDLLPYLQFAVNPTVAAVMPDAADEAVAEYGSEALGEKVFGTAPTPELQRVRDDARLAGSLAGAGEAITARGANMVGDGISAFMKFLDRGEAVTPEGITAAIPDTSITKIVGGRMAKDGPSKFSEARAARRTKDEQELFDETGAYFDDEVFPDESSAFRFEIPTVDSELKGIEDVVRKSNDSSAGPGPRNYFYMDDKTDVTALKGDVVAVNLLPNSRVSFETQIVNAAGELEPAKYPRLSEILDFPELYKQYPQLKDVYVARLNGGAQALMMEKGIDRRPTIALGAAFSPQMLQSHLLHEVQHVVQKIEDFPRGGDTAKMSDEDYRRLAGEVEARNVEDRFLAARAFRKSGAGSDTIPPIYDPSKVVPTQTRDTNPSQILLDDSASAVQLSRLTGFSPDEMGEKIGGILINPQNEPGRFFISDLGGSEVTLKPSVDMMGEVRPNTIEIDVLFGKPRRQGHGSEILNRINRLADETGTTMRLFPTPIESPGQPTIRLDDLVDFYKSKGFEFEDPDPNITELDRYMVRYPRKAEGGVVSMVDVARNAGRGLRGVASLAPVARNMNRSMLG